MDDNCASGFFSAGYMGVLTGYSQSKISAFFPRGTVYIGAGRHFFLLFMHFFQVFFSFNSLACFRPIILRLKLIRQPR